MFNIHDHIHKTSIADITSRKDARETSEKYNKHVKIFLEKWNIRTNKIKPPTFLIIGNVLEHLRLPEPGEQIRIRTQQQINLISILLKVVEQNERINDLIITTYTMNKEAWSVIVDLIETGKIEKLTLCIASSYSFRDSEHKKRLIADCLRLSQEHDVRLFFADIHFKICLMKCGENFYLHEGSMNWSTNNMAENLIFENCRESYNHDFRFIVGLREMKNNKALEIIC